MSNNHAAHTATLLPDGAVLVAGSYDADGAPASAELFNPSTGSWIATGGMIYGRAEYTATLLPDGRVLVAGDFNGLSGATSAELYDPSTGTWTATGRMTEGRSAHTATLLPDGRVLVAGGDGKAELPGPAAVPTTELYDPSTGSWTAAGAMISPRRFHTTTLLLDGTVLVAGGVGDPGYPAVAELYDPRSGKWTATGAMAAGRSTHTATLLPNGTVLVAGGLGESGAPAFAELYDPKTGSWSPSGSMIEPRFWHTATLLLDGTVLVAGGDGGAGVVDGEDPALRSAELYHPSSQTWIATADLNLARRNHTATLLQDGSVLVAGGIGPSTSRATSELYEPGSGG